MKIKFTFGAFLLLFSLILSNNFTYAVIYIFCAAIHEFGHLFAAKKLKIKISEMSFDIAGAKIVPAGHIGSYRSEFLLCAAGPIASILLSALSLAIYSIKLGRIDFNLIMSGNMGTFGSITLSIALFSAMQAIINLVPISSFDGGRMMNAVIVYLFGERAGEVSAKVVTFLFALILWLISVYLLLRAGQGLSLFSFSLCMFLKIFEEG